LVLPVQNSTSQSNKIGSQLKIQNIGKYLFALVFAPAQKQGLKSDCLPCLFNIKIHQKNDKIHTWFCDSIKVSDIAKKC